MDLPPPLCAGFVARTARWKIPWGNGDVIRRIEVKWHFQDHHVQSSQHEVRICFKLHVMSWVGSVWSDSYAPYVPRASPDVQCRYSKALVLSWPMLHQPGFANGFTCRTSRMGMCCTMQLGQELGTPLYPLPPSNINLEI